MRRHHTGRGRGNRLDLRRQAPRDRHHRRTCPYRGLGAQTMTTPTIKRRVDRLDGGGAHRAYDFGNMTDDQLDELIAEQLDAKGIIDTATYWAMPRTERWNWLDAHK